MHQIAIRPMGDGWTVQFDGVGNDMVYRRGGQAEATARRLGAALAKKGESAEIHIYLRDGRLVL